MANNNQASLTDKNLDQLADLLNRELVHSTLAKQIPDGAHIFHGTYNDADLTQANLKLASKILLGMTLGYVEEAPLVMIFEQNAGQHRAIDLSTASQKDKAENFIAAYQEQSQQDLTAKLSELLAV